MSTSMERRATEKAQSKIYQLLFTVAGRARRAAETEDQRAARLRATLQTRYKSERKDSYGEQSRSSRQPD